MRTQILGVVGAFAGAAAGAKLFNETIGAAAKFEASEIAIEAIFNDKGLSDSYLKMVDKMAIDSPLLNSTEMLASSKGIVAMTKNMDDLGKTWSIIEKLQVLDPTQGTDGAAFAVKEMFQGDALSMVERFGLNKKELNRIKKLSIPQQLAEIDSLLNGMGVTEKAIQAMGKTTLGYWAQIGERTEKFMRSIGSMGNSKIGEVLGGIVDKFDSIDLDAIAAKIDAGVGGAIQKVLNFTKKAWEMRKPILAVIKSVGIFVGTVVGIVAVISSISAVGAVFAFLLSPIGLAAAAVIGIGEAFKKAYATSEPFRAAVDGVVGSLKGLFAIITGGNAKGMDVMTKAGLDTAQIQNVYAFADTLKGAFGKVTGAFEGISEIFAGNKSAGIAALLEANFSMGQIDVISTFAGGLKTAFDKVTEIFTGLGTLMTGGGSADLLASMGISQTAFNEFKDSLPLIKESLIAAAVAIGTFKLAVVGLTMISTVVTAIKAWRAATVGMTLAQVILNGVLAINPIILIAMAIAGLVTAGVMLWRNWDVVKEKTVALWDSMGGLKGAMAIILGPIGFLINAAMDLAKNWDSTKSVWENVWSAIQRSAATSVNAVIGLINEMIGVINKIPGVNIPIVAKVDWGAATSSPADFRQLDSASMNKGKSHYHGIDYVPTNSYQANLHKGEAVLTAAENKQRQQGGSGGIVIHMNGTVIREEADVEKVARGIVNLIEQERVQMA